MSKLYILNKYLVKSPLCVFVACNVKGKVQSAVLKYSYRSDGHLHLLSTQVPESFRGKGVAASLAKVYL